MSIKILESREQNCPIMGSLNGGDTFISPLGGGPFMVISRASCLEHMKRKAEAFTYVISLADGTISTLANHVRLDLVDLESTLVRK